PTRDRDRSAALPARRSRRSSGANRSRRSPRRCEPRATALARRPQRAHGRTDQVRRRARTDVQAFPVAEHDLDHRRVCITSHLDRHEAWRCGRGLRPIRGQLPAPIPEAPWRNLVPPCETRPRLATLAPLRNQACHPRRRARFRHRESSCAENPSTAGATQDGVCRTLTPTYPTYQAYPTHWPYATHLASATHPTYPTYPTYPTHPTYATQLASATHPTYGP